MLLLPALHSTANFVLNSPWVVFLKALDQVWQGLSLRSSFSFQQQRCQASAPDHCMVTPVVDLKAWRRVVEGWWRGGGEPAKNGITTRVCPPTRTGYSKLGAHGCCGPPCTMCTRLGNVLVSDIDQEGPQVHSSCDTTDCGE